MSADGAVLVWRDGVPSVVDPSTLPVPQPADLAAALRRIAALEALPRLVMLPGVALPVATLQVGTFVYRLPCKGLLPADRVSLQPSAGAALPSGLATAWARPDAPDVLALAVAALSVVAVKAPIPFDVWAVRAAP